MVVVPVPLPQFCDGGGVVEDGRVEVETNLSGGSVRTTFRPMSNVQSLPSPSRYLTIIISF